MLLSFQISQKLSGEFCFIHHMGISTSMADETAIVKVCCPYFKEEIEGQLRKQFAPEFSNGKIRIQLPGITINDSSSTGQSEDAASVISSE
ncbi:MAG TPA: hypothetical protein VIM89_09495 [Mucilaginibacter sp.]